MISFTWSILFFEMFNTQVVAQIPKKLVSVNDSLEEEIIYVDDTLYLAPDTIKMIDTIVHYLPDVHKTITPKWEMGIYVQPYEIGFFTDKIISDSASLLKTSVYDVDLQLHHYSKHMVYGFSAGYKKVNERFLYSHFYYTNSDDVLGVYDSLRLKKDYTIENYYSYCNIAFAVGRYWSGKKFAFSCNAFLMFGILTANSKYHLNISYIDSQIQSSNIKKTLFAVGIGPCLAYKIASKTKLNLSLNYEFYPENTHNHPVVYNHVLGFGTGISMLL